LSNVKQIQLGVMMYASDYDGLYPPEPLSTAPLVTWATAPTGYQSTLYPYTENTQIFACPGLPGVLVGYALNWWMVGPGAAAAQKSAQKITFMDGVITSAAYTTQWYAYPAGGIGDPDSAFSSGVNPSNRHNEGANFAYADGHAKWSRVELFAASSGTDANFINSWSPSG
jgi:prepilin-type processing-associated H-X9-DG protein